MTAVTVKDVPVQIEIDIQDSCNCCWFCCKSNKPVYITHDYQAEEFDRSKSADIEQDRIKSFERIHTLFGQLELEALSDHTFQKKVSGKFLTEKDIIRINALIKEALRGKNG